MEPAITICDGFDGSSWIPCGPSGSEGAGVMPAATAEADRVIPPGATTPALEGRRVQLCPLRTIGVGSEPPVKVAPWRTML